VFDLVGFYADYYREGAGTSHPDAVLRAKNAARVRFNIELKLNPRRAFAARTVEPEAFVDAVARVLLGNHLEDRADLQSFDFRVQLRVQEKYPEVRTVYLFGDSLLAPDGGNLQPEGTGATPWLGGLPWPYRATVADQPFRVQASGGFEGLALSPDGTTLYPMLEKPLADGPAGTLLIHAFDLAQRRYTGVRHLYPLESRGVSATDFVLFADGRGVVLERDNTQGDPLGFKSLQEVRLVGDGLTVTKRRAVDLLRVDNPLHLTRQMAGEVGLGDPFAFPFITIEAVLVFDARHVGVLNDNNFPFSVGRHVRAGRPDDNEFIRVALEQPLGSL
jgi:glycerophosphoryl diester phosphodiesterase